MMANKVEINTMTFEEVLREAQDFGFTTYRDPETLRTMDIDCVLEELEDDTDNPGPADYIRFRNVIVQASGAWSLGDDSLVYELD